MRKPADRARLRRQALFVAIFLYVIVRAGMIIRDRTLKSEGTEGQSGDSSAFVSLTEVDPSIAVEARYATSRNFLGRPVKGYASPKCLLTRRAADALKAAQAEARQFGLSLRVYDCYRPQRAVDDFVAWAGDLKDEKMKREYYPRVPKSRLFDEGYIFGKSGHSRGSTVDLTLDGLEMGTPWDYFDELAHTANPKVNATARRNRMLLKTLLEKHGFTSYEKEWWHFTLANEPYPETYFDHEVR